MLSNNVLLFMYTSCQVEFCSHHFRFTILQESALVTKGHSFISVVDIDLPDVPVTTHDALLITDRHSQDALPQPTQLPIEAQTREVSTPPPSPTNAELHYNALFLKDAHPKKTPPKVQFDESDGGGPDAVTVKVLERRVKADKYIYFFI